MAEYVTGLERTQEYIDRLQGVRSFLKPSLRKKRNPVQEAVVGLMLDHSKNVLDAAKNIQAFNVHLVRQLPGNPGCDGYRLLQPGF